jgi:vitamin B12 transporter
VVRYIFILEGFMNKKIKVSPILMILCGLLLSDQVSMAEQPDDKSTDVYTLGEIVVPGKTEGVQASESVYTVTAKDIQNKNARTLDQAINLLPGINVRTAAQGVPRIDIRGFRTRHIVLLLDGIPINSAFDAQFDPTAIPTENIAKIKVTTGASSILYGQGGLGGVINIVTKKGIKEYKEWIGGESGDHEPYLFRATASGGTGMFNYFLSGSASDVNSFPLSSDFVPTSEQPAGYRLNSDRKRNNLFLNFGFNPNEDLTLGLTASYSNGSYGIPGSIINNPFDPFAAPPRFERIDNYNGYSVQLAADYQATKRFSVRGWTYINYLFQHDNQYDNSSFNSFNLVPGSFQERIRTTIEGISLQPKYDMGKAGSVTLALSIERDIWKNDGQENVALDTFNPVNIDHSFNIYSTGFEYDVSPLKGLGLTAGFGYYWKNGGAQNQNGYSVLAGAYYDILMDTRLRASYKRNIRFPTLGDLYNPNQGNPFLLPEHAYTYEVGVDQKLPLSSVASLTGFYTIAKNLIQNDQTVGRNQNLSEVDFAGFELAAATEYVKNLLLRLSYTYMDSEDRSRPGRDQQQYTPGNKVTAEAKYDFASGFSPYVSVLYVGNQYFYTRNAVTPVQKLKLQNFTLVNVKVSQKFLKNKLNVYFGVDNLFDKDYETSYGFPQEGRFIYGGIQYSFGI